MKILLIILFCFYSCSESFKKRSIYDLSISRKIIALNSVKPAITPTPIASPNLNKYIFVTVSTHNARFGIDSTLALNGAINGNGNAIEEADQFCRKEKDLNFSTLSGTAIEYKALIVQGIIRRACSTPNCSGGITESIDWVLKPDTTYYRSTASADIILFKTDLSVGVFKFIAGNTLTNPFEVSGANFVWTGFGQNWTEANSSFGNCSDWNNIGIGTVGALSSITATSLDDTLGQNCNALHRLVCVRQ
jgi:hypothetical protein